MTKPTPYDREVLVAIRALFAGEATEGQQTRAMRWIIQDACHAGYLSFNVASDRLSAFRDGERHIGLQLARMREPEGMEQLLQWEAETVQNRAKRAPTKARGE